MRRTGASGACDLEVHLRHLNLLRSGRSILRDICWTIRPTERWVLAGTNGAGKTQLLKLISGSVWPTPRRADATGLHQRRYLRGREHFHTPFEVQHDIVYVGPERQAQYQRHGWNHTVEQIIGTGIHRTQIPLEPLSTADGRLIATILRRLEIIPLAGRRFLSLSYGEQRLTLLARALAARPKLLLLDELLTGLDEEHRARVSSWLEHSRRSALPWILATHRLADVPDSATHALVLDKGRVVYRNVRRRVPLTCWLANDAAPGKTRCTSWGSRPVATRVGRASHRAGSGTSRRWANVGAGSQASRQGSRAASSEQSGRMLLRMHRAAVYLDERQVLGPLTLEVRAHECWLVHGSNGCGKTTLLRTLYGDHGVARGGRIERSGIGAGIALETFRRRVGLVAPHLHVDQPQTLTVAEAIQSGRHASIGLNEPATRADQLGGRSAMRAFGLSALRSRSLRELSHGQLRRVVFARAWVCRPKLLLLDEPFSGLDRSTRESLKVRIETLLAGGSAAVIATHDPSDWPASTTHELHLIHGRAEYCGPVRSARFISDPRSGAAI